MARVKLRNILSGITVKEAMQANMAHLPENTPLKAVISHFIKYKTRTVLIRGTRDGQINGMVSRTDLTGAFYAGLSVEIPVSGIMTEPPVTCRASDSLEAAMETMKSGRMHQVYVTGTETDQIAGLLDWSDIMGLLYRYCRACTRSGRREIKIQGQNLPRLRVRDVMTQQVARCETYLHLAGVIEVLSERQIGALLVTDTDSRPAGVISKTDLIVAYARGLGLDEPARTIMNSPVTVCKESDLISEAISRMLLFDIQRLFVQTGHRITGVLSLSDVARLRSGTCRACAAGRIAEN